MARARSLVLHAVLFVWIFWLYRGAWVDLAGEDHGALLHELCLFPGRWAGFWHTVTWDTSHVLMADARGLVRPAFWMWHAILEVLLHVDEKGRGIAGLAMLFVAAAAFRAFARQRVSEVLAWCATWSVVTVYPGLNLVLWRHSTPYLLGLALVALALRDLPRHPIRAGILLLISSLVHEIVGVACLATAGFALLFLRAPRERMRIALATGVPGLVMALAQVAVRLTAPVDANHGGQPVLSAIAWTPWVLGQWVMGWAVPAAFFVLPQSFHRSITRPVPVPWAVFEAIGWAALAAYAVALVFVGRRWLKGQVERRDVAVLVAGAIPPLLAVVFAVVRIPMLSYEYISLANYYYAYVGFLLSLVVVAAAEGSRASVQRVAALAFLLVTVTSAQGVRRAIDKTREADAAIYELHHAMTRVFAERTDLCFAGLLDDADRAFFVDTYPFAFLGEPTCPFRVGTPTFLGFDGGFVLRPIGLGGAVEGVASARARFEAPANVTLTAGERFVVGGQGMTPRASLDGRSLLRENRQPQIVGRPDGTHAVEIRIIEGHAYALYDGLAIASYGAMDSIPEPMSAGATLELGHAPAVFTDRIPLDTPLANARRLSSPSIDIPFGL